ncbi:MAG TPA: hypothetical protein VHC21_03825 [Candidatus Saccharimonadales bacterium]|nr:hypothetical protein [Candidatus Saccharimonadales bacterium]
MIELEPFSEHQQGALAQARHLKPLIDKERGWLAGVQPGTVERYQSVITGAENIRRIALFRQAPDVPVEANIVRRGAAAIGLATIIRNQLIVHPEEGEFRGADVDYWLRRCETPATHRQVAQQLLAQAGGTALATIVGQHPQPAIGLAELMEPVGEPAQLTTGERHDSFEVARPGEIAQLYVAGAPDA